MTAFLNYCLFATLVLARSTDAFKCGTSVTTECLGATDIRYDPTASNDAADQAEGECLVSCRLLRSLMTCSHLAPPLTFPARSVEEVRRILCGKRQSPNSIPWSKFSLIRVRSAALHQQYLWWFSTIQPSHCYLPWRPLLHWHLCDYDLREGWVPVV